MSTKKTIAKSFTVSTIEDGVSVQAQYAPNANPTSGQIHTVWQEGDLYMRTRESDESAWSSWHKIVGESGDETDFSFGISQYKTTANASTAPSDISSWSDAPLAVTTAKPYLWAKVQQKSWNASTQAYVVDSTRYIRLTGEDGYTVEAQYAPNNNPTSSQIHTTWQDGDLYMRTKQSNETTWSSWHKIVGESGDETDYTFNISKSLTSTNATTAPANCYYNTWQDAPIAPTSTYPYLWMKIVKKTWNESTQSYDSGTARYSRVTGEKGDKGADAPYIELSRSTILYQANNDGYSIASQNFAITYALKVKGNTCTISSTSSISISLPSDVTVVSGTKTTSGCTINCTHSKIMSGVITITITGTYDGVTYTATGTITVDSSRQGEQGTPGEPGGPGERGKVGRFFYYAGEFDSSNTTQTFVVNDAQAPYFFYKNPTTGAENYWVFNPTNNGTYTMSEMGTPSPSSSNWKLMTSEFKYIITEAIFGSYAHFGSAIISGDWFLSENGTINGVASTNYTSFDPDHPADNNTTNFVPNYCVDLKTGASYQQNAYIRGTIYATNGTIGGFKIGENKIGGVSEISGGFQGTNIYPDGRALIGNMNYDYGLRTTGGVEMIGNGKTIVINTATGSPTNHGFLLINGYIKLVDIPRSTAGLQSGEIYVDSSGNVKMVL